MATVRDQVEFEALPEEVQALARRVLNAPVTADPGSVEAYRKGWEDAVDEVELLHPRVPDAERIARRLRPAGAQPA